MNSPIAAEFVRINKAYGDCWSSRDLSFSVRRGTIHGLIGENGAGKSTAMKILFGLVTPDSGRLRVDGRDVNLRSPNDAMALGIGMVHQHFMLAGPFSALDNLMLAENGGAWSLLDRRAALAKYSALAERAGFSIDFEKAVDELPVGVQQRLEILKLLARDARLLIFDEPTAVLTPQEVRDFFTQVRQLRAEGRTVIIISHKLREIMELTDEVTVLRQGSAAASRKTSETSVEELAELMIGKKDHRPQATASKPGASVARLRNVSVAGHVPLIDFDLDVRAGEIVGIAGVEGNGQDTLIDLLCDGRIAADGEILGQRLGRTDNARLRAGGAAFFPENRLRFGVLENRSAAENFLLGQQNQDRFRKGPFIDLAAWRATVEASFREYDVQPMKPDLALGRFSGGNQQKIVVARELANAPKFILAAQPTRGVDLGAVRFIHGKLLEAKSRGAGILLISSELEELMELSDRIVVLFGGRAKGRFERHEFNESRIGLAMGGKDATE